MRTLGAIALLATMASGCAFRGAGRSILGGAVPDAGQPAAPVIIAGAAPSGRALLPLEIVARDADGLPWGGATLQGLADDGWALEVTTNALGYARTVSYSPAIPRWRAAREGGGWSRVLVTPAVVPLETGAGWRLIVTIVEAGGGK